MVALPWVLCGALLLLVFGLIVKIKLMQKSMTEITEALSEHLQGDTNNLITVSTRDKQVRRLAAALAGELALLRRQRQQYLCGDRELKEAVTNISHDLRTPLTAICGYLDLLEREDLPVAVQGYLAHIKERAEAMRALTEELFRYSVLASVSALQRERLDVCRVLTDSLLSFYGALSKQGIEPEISLPQDGLWRTLDKGALARIFENILSNAVKYSQGDLTVTVGDDGHIAFSNGARNLTSVDVGKLFDRFFTVEPTRRSSGLGLSIAKLLCERMGGTVGAALLDGTLTVTVYFP